MTQPAITIVVRGTPAPQGSKSPKGRTKTGRTIMVESSAKVKPWREAVRSTAADTAEAVGLVQLDGPLEAEMVFTATRPKSHFGTGRNAGVLRASAPSRPATAPDLSKLARSTEDALTDAGVWRDDARVVEYRRLAKVWAGEDRDALATPGAVIRIYVLEDA